MFGVLVVGCKLCLLWCSADGMEGGAALGPSLRLSYGRGDVWPDDHGSLLAVFAPVRGAILEMCTPKTN